MSKQIVLFIHGLFGDSRDTWGAFPDLVRSDPELGSSWEPVTFSFPSPKFRLPFIASAPAIHTLADGLKTEIEVRYHDATSLVLVAHSLGGLVARQYILDQFKILNKCKIKCLLLFSTPNNGAALANLGSHISRWQPQLRQLCRQSEFLMRLNRDWLDMNINEKFRTICVVGGGDDVVTEESARAFWPTANIRTIVNASHTDIVKPKNREDLRYQVLRKLLLSETIVRPTVTGFLSPTEAVALFKSIVGSLEKERINLEVHLQDGSTFKGQLDAMSSGGPNGYMMTFITACGQHRYASFRDLLGVTAAEADSAPRRR